jgi:hypothetical protein
MYIFGPMHLSLPFNTQTMYIKSIMRKSIAMFSLKALNPGGIQTRVACSSGGCDVHCAEPTRHGSRFIALSHGALLIKLQRSALSECWKFFSSFYFYPAEMRTFLNTIILS